MSMDLQRFHATYFEESREGLDAMEAGLLALEGGSLDPEVVNSVFRAAHSIKGGAATFGFEKMAALTHVLETLLDEIRAGKRALAASAVDAMLGSVDVLRALLAEAEQGKPADPAAVAAVHARLGRELGAGAETAAVAAKEPEPEGWNIAFAPAPSLFMSGNDPLRILRELEHLGRLDVAAKLERLPAFSQLDPLEACIAGTWACTARFRAARSTMCSPGWWTTASWTSSRRRLSLLPRLPPRQRRQPSPPRPVAQLPQRQPRPRRPRPKARSGSASTRSMR